MKLFRPKIDYQIENWQEKPVDVGVSEPNFFCRIESLQEKPVDVDSEKPRDGKLSLRPPTAAVSIVSEG